MRAITKVVNRNIRRVAKGRSDKLRRSRECVMGCEWRLKVMLSNNREDRSVS